MCGKCWTNYQLWSMVRLTIQSFCVSPQNSLSSSEHSPVPYPHRTWRKLFPRVSKNEVVRGSGWWGNYHFHSCMGELNCGTRNTVTCYKSLKKCDKIRLYQVHLKIVIIDGSDDMYSLHRYQSYIRDRLRLRKARLSTKSYLLVHVICKMENKSNIGKIQHPIEKSWKHAKSIPLSHIQCIWPLTFLKCYR
jgi:hypothetical protein